MSERHRRSVDATVASRGDELLDLSHRIHAQPELAFEEFHAVATITEFLGRHGFEVESGAFGLATAFDATIGNGGLVLVLCAEYDALPEIGHACGHNVIATAAVGAAIALAPLVDELGVTLRVLGTPAEEGGGGKILLLENGAFAGVHAALMAHPGPIDLPYMPTLATVGREVEYRGVAAHASAFPERGINAADSMTVAQVAIGLLRQHFEPSQRVHGIVTRAGSAPNVIPDQSAASYLLRAADLESLGELIARVERCFQAGALATGTTVEIRPTTPPYAELTADPLLTASWVRNVERLGRRVNEVTERAQRAAGSTDLGNVSQVLPVIHPMIGLGKGAGAPHQPQFAVAAGGAAGDAAALDAARALAGVVIDAATDRELRAALEVKR